MPSPDHLEPHTLQIAGCGLHYRRGGEGPSLLFLHGAGGADTALPVMKTLSEHHDVIVPDHPGFGASDEPGWLDNVHDMAYFYLDVLEALELTDVHLAGASLGGWIALEIAVRNSTRLGKLSLIGSAGISLPDVPTGDIFMWDPEQSVRNLVHDAQLAERILSLEKTPEQLEIAIKNSFTTARLAWEPRLFDPHLHKWLHRVDVPTHLLWGANDAVVPLAYGEALQKLIPGSRLSVIDACGHLPHVEKPDEFVALLRDT